MQKALFVFIFGINAVLAQSSSQKEINEQVWKRFVESYNGQNTEAFMGIHSSNLVRMPIGEGKISRFEQYKVQNEQNFAYQKNTGTKISIEFTFAYRTVTGSVAYEIGYYRVASQKDNKTNYYYGMFNVILRKENGTWKILSDADTGEDVTEAKFKSGKDWSYVF